MALGAAGVGDGGDSGLRPVTRDSVLRLWHPSSVSVWPIHPCPLVSIVATQAHRIYPCPCSSPMFTCIHSVHPLHLSSCSPPCPPASTCVCPHSEGTCQLPCPQTPQPGPGRHHSVPLCGPVPRHTGHLLHTPKTRSVWDPRGSPAFPDKQCCRFQLEVVCPEDTRDSTGELCVSVQGGSSRPRVLWVQSFSHPGGPMKPRAGLASWLRADLANRVSCAHTARRTG